MGVHRNKKQSFGPRWVKTRIRSVRAYVRFRWLRTSSRVCVIQKRPGQPEQPQHDEFQDQRLERTWFGAGAEIKVRALDQAMKPTPALRASPGTPAVRTLMVALSRARDAPLNRICRIAEPRRRWMAGGHQAIDQRLVCRRELMIERGDVASAGPR